jgi:lysozyme
MNISPHGLDFITHEEGVVLHPYLDKAGVPTIGIGTTRYPNGTHVTMQDSPITLEQAKELLTHDSVAAQDAVNAMINSVRVSQNGFDALVSFAYNEGTGALHGSTLLRLIRANPADPNITAAFAMWDKLHVNGELVYSADLAGRRKREAALYFTP